MLKDSEDDSQRVELKLEMLQLTDFLDILISIVEFRNRLLSNEFLFNILLFLGRRVDRLLPDGHIGDNGQRLVVLSYLKFGVSEVNLCKINGRFVFLDEVVLCIFGEDVDNWLSIFGLLLF